MAVLTSAVETERAGRVRSGEAFPLLAVARPVRALMRRLPEHQHSQRGGCRQRTTTQTSRPHYVVARYFPEAGRVLFHPPPHPPLLSGPPALPPQAHSDFSQHAHPDSPAAPRPERRAAPHHPHTRPTRAPHARASYTYTYITHIHRYGRSLAPEVVQQALRRVLFAQALYQSHKRLAL